MALPTQTDHRAELLEKLESWSERVPLTVAAVDVDGFASINDKHGREVGDRVLQAVIAAIESMLPEGSLLVRTGGDEFVCLLPDTRCEEALITLDGARRKIASKSLSVGKSKVVISLSAGIASFPQHAEDPGDLLNAADAALLSAKESGRGRVRMYVEDKMVLKSNYYPRAQLSRLATLAQRLGRTEASLLREALAETLNRYRHEL